MTYHHLGTASLEFGDCRSALSGNIPDCCSATAHEGLLS